MGLNKPHLRYKDQTPRERTWTIHFISVMKFVKGVVLVVIGIKLLTLLGRDVEAWATGFVTRHGIDLANKFVHSILEKLSGVGNTQLIEFSTVAFLYSALLFTEGLGLWLQKRWAEYLTAIATGLLIPLELYEIYEKFTWVRVGILAVNLFIVWYLVTRLKDEKTENSRGGKHRTRVKICGITDSEDASLAIKHGADELGFNFYDKSPRYVSPEKAGEIIRKLPRDITKIGVFVNESVERICEVVSIAGLDAVQLHGDERHDFVANLNRRLGLNIIKAFRVKDGIEFEQVNKFESHYILLDSYSTDEYGGSGQRFDWAFVEAISVLLPQTYLAGGLTPENVGEAIRKVRPYAVDVCSRIESEPGKKDEDKLRRFIAAVRETV